MGFCVQSARSFFCNTNNQLAKFLNSLEGQDKLAKLATDGVFPLVAEVARISEASERTMSNINTGHEAVKVARDVFGVLNIFRGVIPGIVVRGNQIGKLVRSLHTDETVILKPPNELRADNPANVHIRQQGRNQLEPSQTPVAELRWTVQSKHNELAVTTREKLFKLGENAGGMIGALTYLVGFGLARPAANARKYFKLEDEYGNVGKGIANSFQPLMCANHIGSMIQSSFELAYQFEAYNRAVLDPQYNLRQVNRDFETKIIDSIMVMSERVLDLINDTLFFTNAVPSPWFKIILGLGTSGLGLVRVWRKLA